jgi:hypothetical protein
MTTTLLPLTEYKRFRLASNLVTRISCFLDSGRRHYRTKAGKLLTTLDEVILAILAGELGTGR